MPDIKAMKRAAMFFSELSESTQMGAEFGRGHDLTEWNVTQYSLWQEVREYLPEMSDLEELDTFSRFAKFFYDYFVQTDGSIPDADEVLEFLQD